MESDKQSVADEIHTVEETSEHKEKIKATPTAIAASKDAMPAAIPTAAATEEVQLDEPTTTKSRKSSQSVNPYCVWTW